MEKKLQFEKGQVKFEDVFTSSLIYILYETNDWYLVFACFCFLSNFLLRWEFFCVIVGIVSAFCFFFSRHF